MSSPLSWRPTQKDQCQYWANKAIFKSISDYNKDNRHLSCTETNVQKVCVETRELLWGPFYLGVQLRKTSVNIGQIKRFSIPYRSDKIFKFKSDGFGYLPTIDQGQNKGILHRNQCPKSKHGIPANYNRYPVFFNQPISDI